MKGTERFVCAMKTARISAKSRHDQKIPRNAKAAAGKAMACSGNARFRVKMAADFRHFTNGPWLMPEHNAIDPKLSLSPAAAEFRRFRIVISADPDPFAGARA